MLSRDLEGVAMWVGVGVLLGLMVVASVLGFHVGPHGHLAAFGLGVAAAIWLVVMAATGRSEPLLWVLFGADVAISGGLGAIAWRGLRLQDDQLSGASTMSLVGAEGVAVTDLEPGGVVRVRGENWSATSMNGSVAAGHRIQVIEASGVRLSVWSEDDEIAELEGHHQLLNLHRHHGSHDEEQEGAQ
jgi:membrane-bound ClpP family serine protease